MGGLLVSLLLMTSPSWAQPPSDGSIYTCIDPSGRVITSDRPILSCIETQQRELGPSGTTKRLIDPAPTANEQKMRRQENRQQAHQAEQEKSRVAQQKQRDEALLIRYPDAQAHTQARQLALRENEAAHQAAGQRLAQLIDERLQLEEEMEFYAGKPDTTPAYLKRNLQSNREAIQSVRQLMDHLADEHDRINQRYDQELEYLQALWLQKDKSASAPAS